MERIETLKELETECYKKNGCSCCIERMEAIIKEIDRELETCNDEAWIALHDFQQKLIGEEE